MFGFIQLEADCLQGFDNTVFVYTFRFIRHCLPDFIDNALEKNNY